MRALSLIGCAASICLAATPTFAYPTGAEALEARLLAKVGPDTRAWIAGEAAREASLRILSGGTTMAAVLPHSIALDTATEGEAGAAGERNSAVFGD